MEEKTSAQSVSGVSATVEKPKHSLGFSELYALGVGQVIGAGVVTVLGAAMAVTGKSVWIAYFAAVVLGFMNIWPTFVYSSMARLNGGGYSMVAALCPPIFAGITLVSFIPTSFALSLFGIALGQYTQSLIPQFNPRTVGVIITTFFYLINLVKIKDMARVQKLMTWLLITTLVLFCIFGLPKVNSAPFDFSAADYFSGGSKGFITAVILLVYSTTSYNMVINYGRDAKRPKKNIPNSMWLSILTITILYSLIAIVASGILPIGDVAGKPLTYVARIIMPGPLFILFIGGGVIMALATTLNSMFGSFANVLLAGARDGWFPRSMAQPNRFGRPWIMITIIYIISIVPIIANLNVATVTNNIVLLSYTVKIIAAVSLYILPFRYPDLCKKSKYFISAPFYFITISISNISLIIVTVLSASALTPALVIISLGSIAFCALYSLWRIKAGKIKMENVFILNEGDDD
ncbi:MAG: APC family permease [Treponema sp.]|nr:APC family permease [Treponema sp.]